MQWKEISLAILAGSLVLGIGGSLAAFQDEVNDKPKDKKDNGSKRETLAKPMTEKEARRKAEKLKKELMTPYKKWLDEDVIYIITDEERRVFKNLSTDEEREQFIEQFWLRRDPTPDTV
jgi:predicted ribosomally synthesized peptide with SipW-like signal peptide